MKIPTVSAVKVKLLKLARWTWLYPLIIAVVTLSLSMTLLGFESLWFDEAFSVHLAQRPVGTIIDEFLTINETNKEGPPLYQIVLHFWVYVFGTSEFAVRSLSAIASSVAALLYYLLFRRLSTQMVAIPASLLVALSPVLLWYAQEARGYALTSLLFGASMLLFVRYLDRPSWPRLSALYVVNSLALLTQVLSLEVIFAENVVFLLVRPGGGRALRRWFITQAALLPYLAPAFFLYSRAQTGAPWWIPETTVNSFLNIVGMHTGASFLENPYEVNRTGLYLPYDHWLIYLILIAGLGLVGTYLVTRRALRGAPEDRLALILPVTVVTVVAFPLAISEIVVPYMLPRYMMLGIPSFCFLVIIGLRALLKRDDLFVAVTIILIGFYIERDIFDLQRKQKDNWRAAAEFVESDIQLDQTLIVSDSRGIVPFMYYYRGRVQPAPIDPVPSLVVSPKKVDLKIDSVRGSSDTLLLLMPWGGGMHSLDSHNTMMTHLVRRKKAYKLLGTKHFPGAWGGVLLLRFQIIRPLVGQ